MDTYVIRYANSDYLNIERVIIEMGGNLVFKSPVLPIIYADINNETVEFLKKQFELTYIIKETIGKLQEIEGHLNAHIRNGITLIPDVSVQKLRGIQAMGWATTIGIIDSGANLEFISEQYDFSGYGTVPCLNHGNIVAKIIKNFSPGSLFYSYKVCHNNTIRQIDLLNALIKAASQCNVINMSLGFAHPDCNTEKKCAICEHVDYYTKEMGIAFVTAAGNSGEEDSIDCPGKANESITVGAIAERGLVLADYSSKGIPGIIKPNILTTGTVTDNIEGINCKGTSFATPVIAGVIGSVFNIANGSVAEIKKILYNSAEDIGLPKHHQGFGLLNIDKLTEVLQNGESNIESKKQKSN